MIAASSFSLGHRHSTDDGAARRVRTAGRQWNTSVQPRPTQDQHARQTMIVTVLASAISSIAAYWLFHDTIYRRLRRVEATPAAKRSEAYAERLSHLTNDLTRASRDLDSVLAEVTEVVREREAAVGRLERELGNLELREQELQERITSLQGVPLPVVEHFASITTEGERRSAHRDYRLFIAGVVVSTITSLAFYILGSP